MRANTGTRVPASFQQAYELARVSGEVAVKMSTERAAIIETKG